MSSDCALPCLADIRARMTVLGARTQNVVEARVGISTLLVRQAGKAADAPADAAIQSNLADIASAARAKVQASYKQITVIPDRSAR